METKNFAYHLITKDVDERDRLIEELYHKGIEYYYTDRDKEGNYHVKYN